MLCCDLELFATAEKNIWVLLEAHRNLRIPYVSRTILCCPRSRSTITNVKSPVGAPLRAKSGWVWCTEAAIR